MSENGEIYTAGKNFTLLSAVTGWTNSTILEFKSLKYGGNVQSGSSYFETKACFCTLKIAVVARVRILRKIH